MKKRALMLVLAALLLAGCQPGQNTNSGHLTQPVYPSWSKADASAPPAQSAAANPHEGVALPDTSGEVIEIREKLFIAQTNDIYLNGADYLGKTVKYEGIYKNTGGEEGSQSPVIHYVIRYGPGCCGFDSNAGFEVRWDGDYPNVDDWVEVVGTLHEEQYQSGLKVLYVEVTSMTIKDERGAEYVAT